MEPWPLASFQYVTAVYLILSAQTDWLNSVLAVCLLKRALWTKHYGHFILLLWIFYQWPLVETVRWDFTTEKSVESILYHQCLLASLDSFFIPFSTSDLILSHLKRTKWLSSFSLSSSFFFFFFSKSDPQLSALHSTSGEPLTCGFLLTPGQLVRRFGIFPTVWSQSRPNKQWVVWKLPSFILWVTHCFHPQGP